MNIERTKIPRVVIITPDVYEDERGFFTETLNQYMDFKPVQANMSKSKKGVIRGLHRQWGAAKLVWVAKGSIYDVVYDSDTEQYVSETLSADNHKQMFVPHDMHHGFQALEDDTIVCYLMDSSYDQKSESGLNPNRVEWPLKEQIISDKDSNAD